MCGLFSDHRRRRTHAEGGLRAGVLLKGGRNRGWWARTHHAPSPHDARSLVCQIRPMVAVQRDHDRGTPSVVQDRAAVPQVGHVALVPEDHDTDGGGAPALTPKAHGAAHFTVQLHKGVRHGTVRTLPPVGLPEHMLDYVCTGVIRHQNAPVAVEHAEKVDRRRSGDSRGQSQIEGDDVLVLRVVRRPKAGEGNRGRRRGAGREAGATDVRTGDEGRGGVWRFRGVRPNEGELSEGVGETSGGLALFNTATYQELLNHNHMGKMLGTHWWHIGNTLVTLLD